jgi:ABC-type nickel/cobalt efflux system permease component RcnA
MSIAYVLIAGFVIGLRHALDADHVAAVASLATRSRSVRETVRTGIAWGIGHSVTLLVVCTAILLLDVKFPERIATTLEFVVGVMLILLGLDVLRRVIRDRIHVHGHRHPAGKYHIHMHSHEGEPDHARSEHEHFHPNALPGRALLVGLMHGLAGSAALLLLAVTNQETVWQGLLYVVLFGIGSISGMAILSFAIAWPMMTASKFGSAHFQRFNAVIGLATVILGTIIMAKSAPVVANIFAG